MILNDGVEFTGESVLNVEFYCDDLDRTLTIREWFMEMVKTLWKENEGFSPKRPFGNSGWDTAPALALVECGLVDGKLGTSRYRGVEYKELLDFDEMTYYDLMNEAVAAL